MVYNVVVIFVWTFLVKFGDLFLILRRGIFGNIRVRKKCINFFFYFIEYVFLVFFTVFKGL